jgi:hypothetical protein
MKKMVLLWLTIFIVSCILSSPPREKSERELHFSFHDMDFLYMSDFFYDAKSKKYISPLVFQNIDDDSKKLESLDFKFIKPANSLVPHLLLGLSGQATPSDLGSPAYIETNLGKIYTCHNLPHKYYGINSTQNNDNPYEVVLFNSTEILIFDLSSCSVVEILKNLPKSGDGFIVGATFNRESGDLLYGFVRNPFESSIQYEIVQFNHVSGSEKIITDGLNPSWSPDYSKFAFVRNGGIFLMEMKSGDITRIVDRPKNFSDHPSSLHERPPTVVWSNDGAYLLYEFIKINSSFFTDNDFSVFLYQLETGTESLISESGRYPAWLSYTSEKQP